MSEFDTLLEIVANLCHILWTGWMKYLIKSCTLNDDGTVTIGTDKVSRWTRQMNTPYSQLSEQEQSSDIKEARKFLAVIAQFLLSQ